MNLILRLASNPARSSRCAPCPSPGLRATSSSRRGHIRRFRFRTRLQLAPQCASFCITSVRAFSLRFPPRPSASHPASLQLAPLTASFRDCPRSSPQLALWTAPLALPPARLPACAFRRALGHSRPADPLDLRRASCLSRAGDFNFQPSRRSDPSAVLLAKLPNSRRALRPSAVPAAQLPFDCAYVGAPQRIFRRLRHSFGIKPALYLARAAIGAGPRQGFRAQQSQAMRYLHKVSQMQSDRSAAGAARYGHHCGSGRQIIAAGTLFHRFARANRRATLQSRKLLCRP
jgi:hypothetical protein